MSTDRSTTCPQAEQTAGWVLHTLEPDEEAAVAAHLPGCPSCQALVAGTERSLTELGLAVEQVSPPAALRDRILAAAAATPQELTTPVPGAAPRGAHRARGGRPSGGAGRGPARGPRWLRSPGRRLGVVLAALAAVAGIVGGSIYAAQQRGQDPQAVVAQRILDTVTELQQPGSTYALLAPQGETQVVAAVLVDGGSSQVITAGLPENATDQIYVLWGLGAGPAPEALCTFDVASDTTDPHAVQGWPEPGEYAQYAISIEPGRAAPAAPSGVVAIGPAQQA